MRKIRRTYSIGDKVYDYDKMSRPILCLIHEMNDNEVKVKKCETSRNITAYSVPFVRLYKIPEDVGDLISEIENDSFFLKSCAENLKEMHNIG